MIGTRGRYEIRGRHEELPLRVAMQNGNVVQVEGSKGNSHAQQEVQGRQCSRKVTGTECNVSTKEESGSMQYRKAKNTEVIRRRLHNEEGRGEGEGMSSESVRHVAYVQEV